MSPASAPEPSGDGAACPAANAKRSRSRSSISTHAEQMVAERDRLRALQMRVPRHRRRRFLCGALEDDIQHERTERGFRLRTCVRDVEPKRGRDLVVARPGRHGSSCRPRRAAARLPSGHPRRRLSTFFPRRRSARAPSARPRARRSTRAPPRGAAARGQTSRRSRTGTTRSRPPSETPIPRVRAFHLRRDPDQSVIPRSRARAPQSRRDGQVAVLREHVPRVRDVVDLHRELPDPVACS